MVHLFLAIVFFCLIFPERKSKLLPFGKDPYDPKPFVKCFEQIGCVEVNEKWYHPEYRPVNLEPLDRYLIKTDFVILKYNENEEDKLYFDKILPKKDSIAASGITSNSDTVILIHDFTSTGYTGWVKHLARVLLQKTRSTVISVDWQKGAEPPLDQAIANARVVALETAYFIKLLLEARGIKAGDIHLVGHGVGAHIAAYVGHERRSLKKITGLDPTGPRFEGMPEIVHLNPNSAKYVEVLHTDFFRSRSQGTEERWGHADFYVNNDELQPGCVEWTNFTDLEQVDRDTLSHGEILPGCSHKRAFKYFIEGLDTAQCIFLGVACPTYEDFQKGHCVTCEDTGNRDSGKCRTFGTKVYQIAGNHSYYLNTFDASPYCMITYSVSVILGEDGSQTGYFDMILVDDKNNAANISVVDPESQVRSFSSKSNNTYLYYAAAPQLGVAREAKVRWTVSGNVLCFILCKKSIHVKEIAVKMLVESRFNEQPHISRLCPENGKGEIKSSTFTVFKNCEDLGNTSGGTTTSKKNKTGT